MSRCICPQNTTKSGPFGGWSSATGQPRVKVVEWAQRRHALVANSGFSDSESINAISRESGGASALGIGGSSVMAWGLGGGWLGSSAQAHRRFFAAFQKRLCVQGLLVHMGQAPLGCGLGSQCLEALGVGDDAAVGRSADPVVSLGARQPFATAAGLGDRFAFVFGGRAVQLGRHAEVIVLDGRGLLAQQRTMVHACSHAFAGQQAVDGSGPELAFPFGQCGLLGALARNRVQRHSLLPQASVWVDAARAEQNVGVVIAPVPALARFVDGHVSGHAVALGQMAGKAMRQFLALLGRELGRKRHLHLAASNGVSTLVVGLDPIPKLGPVGGLSAGKAERRKRDALAARVVVDSPGQCIFNPHPCTIGSASGGRVSSRARVSLSSEVVNRQSSLRAQPLGGRAMGGWRAKRAGVSGAKPLTARNPEGITLSALLLFSLGASHPHQTQENRGCSLRSLAP